jgi:universal stress protein E
VPPYEAILDAAAEWRPDLIVVGTHERGALQTRMTDTDWQLIRRTRCPLLLVKGACFSGYRTILAAVERPNEQGQFDDLDSAVLAACRSVARVCKSKVRAVCTHPGAPLDGAATQSVEAAPRDGSDDSVRLQQRAGDALATALGIAPQDVDVVASTPARAIVDAAAHRRAELVVVGAAQRCRIAATFIGNTAELVAGELPCDVLVVPFTAASPRAAARAQR